MLFTTESKSELSQKRDFNGSAVVIGKLIPDICISASSDKYYWL